MKNDPKMKFVERWVPRFGAGGLAFFLGLVVTWCWSSFRQPPLVKDQPDKDSTEIRVDHETELKLKRPPGIAGNGAMKNGARFSFSGITDSEGVHYMQWTEEYRSPHGARRALQEALKSSTRIVKREPLRDENDRVVGEKIIATFSSFSRYGNASLLWTDGSTFRFVTTSELKSLLESQKE